MLEYQRHKPMSEHIELDDAYLGGKRSGQRGCGSMVVVSSRLVIGCLATPIKPDRDHRFSKCAKVIACYQEQDPFYRGR